MKLVRYGPAGKEKPGLHRRRRQAARPFAQGEGHRRREPRARRAREAPQARSEEAAVGEGPSAARPVRRDAVEVRRDRPQLQRSREGIGQSDPRASRRVLQVARPASSAPTTTSMAPRDSTQLDWEVELGVVIGRTARYVEPKDGLKYVAGYCVVNDVSERDFQLKKSATQWNKGKGCDTFGPHRAVARHDRRDQGSAEPRPVARRQRPAPADGQHEAR